MGTAPACNPLVSIITLTYNHERYIGECVESVLRQTYTNWEQIILDDGSTDATAAVISRFNDPRIRYYRQNNSGILFLAQNYNRALARCRGTLIAPLEGDDVWPADKLQAMVPAFDHRHVVAACGICQGIDGQGALAPLEIPSRQMRERYGDAALLNDPIGSLPFAMLQSGITFLSATTVTVRRSALDAIGGFRQTAGFPGMDYPTLLELGLKGKFAFVDRVMCYWRRHGDNLTIRHRALVLRGLCHSALEFVARHQSEPGFPAISAGEIRAHFERDEARYAFLSGRRLLAARQWQQAHDCFRAAFHSPEIAVRAAALCGQLAARFRFTLEPLMRAAGRRDLASLSGL